MRRITIKQWSIVGLMLMAASAVTAAVFPDKPSKKMVNNGSLRDMSANSIAAPGVKSCYDDVDTVDSCTASASFTSDNFIEDSTDGNGLQTQGNTSQTAAQAGDQNSILIQA